MDLVFRALGDPARLALLEELGVRNDQTLFELCLRLIDRGHRMSRQAVAKHLAVLRDAGLLTLSTSGRTTIHHLETATLAEAAAWIHQLVKETTDLFVREFRCLTAVGPQVQNGAALLLPPDQHPAATVFPPSLVEADIPFASMP